MYQFNSEVFMLWLIQPEQRCKTWDRLHLHTTGLVPVSKSAVTEGHHETHHQVLKPAPK